MQEIIHQRLKEIASSRGIEVVEKTFRSDKLKGLYMQDGDIEVIFLNNRVDDLVTKNFTLAHEIGHQELHKGKINNDLYFNDSDYLNKLEEEANLYAGKLINKIIGNTAKHSHTIA